MYKFLTPLGEIDITLLGHASLYIKWNETNIYVDPYSSVADYSVMPEAHLVLLTHHHYDHLDQEALKHIVTDTTEFVTSHGCKSELTKANAVSPGDFYNYNGLKIDAVYAYNIINLREDGLPFHSKGEGNGYILDFDGYKVYIAGDTEIIPEMNNIGPIDIAFIPKNLPYTMSDEMFIEAVKLIKPKNLFAYHYFNIEIDKLRELMPSGVILQNK